MSSEPTEKLRVLSQSALKDLNETIGKSKSFIEKTSKKYLELTNNRVMKNVVSHLKNYFSPNIAEPSYQEIETDLNNNANMNSTFLNDHSDTETNFSYYSSSTENEILLNKLETEKNILIETCGGLEGNKLILKKPDIKILKNQCDYMNDHQSPKRSPGISFFDEKVIINKKIFLHKCNILHFFRQTWIVCLLSISYANKKKRFYFFRIFLNLFVKLIIKKILIVEKFNKRRSLYGN